MSVIFVMKLKLKTETENMLQHTKRRVELFEVHCLTMSVIFVMKLKLKSETENVCSNIRNVESNYLK